MEKLLFQNLQVTNLLQSCVQKHHPTRVLFYPCLHVMNDKDRMTS